MIKKLSLFLIFLFLILPLFSGTEEPKYKKLFEFIEETKFVDVHSHPSTGHVRYEIEDPYPTLEPPISRPFWPIKKERIAVFDSMQVEALREIYGYEKDDVKEKDMEELETLSVEFWKAGEREGFNKILDICGIEKVFSNSKHPRKNLDEKRVLWVPFADQFFYPLDPSGLKAISNFLKESLQDYQKEVVKLSKKFNIEKLQKTTGLHSPIYISKSWWTFASCSFPHRVWSICHFKKPRLKPPEP